MRPVRDVAGSDILWQTVWKTVWQTAWMVWDLLNSCKFCVGEAPSQSALGPRRRCKNAEAP